GAFRRLAGSLRAAPVDVVQTWLFTADLYGRIAARLCRVPVVISSVRSVEDDKPARYVWADRLLAPLTDRFIVNAGAVGERLAEREGVRRERIVTIHNGID